MAPGLWFSRIGLSCSLNAQQRSDTYPTTVPVLGGGGGLGPAGLWKTTTILRKGGLSALKFGFPKVWFFGVLVFELWNCLLGNFDFFAFLVFWNLGFF